MSTPVPELRIEKSKNCHEFYILSNTPRLSLSQIFACCLKLGHEDVSKSHVTNVPHKCVSDTLLSF